MLRADDAEMTNVNGSNVGNVKALCNCDDGCVDATERKVCTLGHKFSSSLVNLHFEIDNAECLAGERAQECCSASV